MKKYLSVLTMMLLGVSMCVQAHSADSQENESEDYKPKVIVIDAGHGGKFSGAFYSDRKIVGYKDEGKTKKTPIYETLKTYREQDISLENALELKKLLEKDPRFKVVLTRETDKEIGKSLAEDFHARLKVAEDNNANLFISLHVNSTGPDLNKECKSRGFEILYRSTGNGDSGKLDTLRGKTEQERILDAQRQESAKVNGKMFARIVSDQLQKNSMAENKMPKEDAINGHTIAILRLSRIPAIVIEEGYLCNEKDRKFMTSGKGKKKFADGIYNGIVEYGKKEGWFK